MDTNSTNTALILDSLPYYDDDLTANPDLQAKVDAEIARELKAMPPMRLPPDIQPLKVRTIHPGNGPILTLLPLLPHPRRISQSLPPNWNVSPLSCLSMR